MILLELRTKGMHNVVKKSFSGKLSLLKLLVECEKVSASLRENKFDEDFNSHDFFLPN